MKEFFLPVARGLLRTLFPLTVLLGAMLAASGELRLLGGLLAGYVLGMVYLWNMAFRIWRSGSFSAVRANREMAWGLVLRLFLACGILACAARLSLAAFSAVVLGFLLFYGLSMFHLIWSNGRNKQG